MIKKDDDDDVSFSLQSTLSKRFRGSTPSFYQETPNFMLTYQNYTGQVHQSSGIKKDIYDIAFKS